jgi:hypothetical protein
MPRGKIVFAQIMSHLPWRAFHRCVQRYDGNHKVQDFTCLDQFLAMAFAQLTFRSGLRGIETTLRANAHCLYHMGFRCATISRNTLAHANETRPWQIYAEFALLLMAHARVLYAHEELAVDLDAAVFALDSTTIDLCLALFAWTPSSKGHAALKVHTLLNLRGNIPEFIRISHGKMHDMQILDELVYEAGAFYICDRGYLDFQRLHHLHRQGAFFVTRAKKGLDFQVRAAQRVDKSTGLRCDQRIALQGFYSAQRYPDSLRRIKYVDPHTEKRLTFLTNNLTLPPLTIAQLYQQRWQVELFFKWIKQHLRIRCFYGYSENAVRTQIWIAVSVYVLLAILRKELGITRELHDILEILSASIFQEIPLLQAFLNAAPTEPRDTVPNQLSLF